MKRISDFGRCLALAGAAGMLLAVLAGCSTLPQSAGENASSSTAESTTSTQETATTEGVASPEESLPDPNSAAVFTYEQCQAAALRAQEYWCADMITGQAAYRYAVAENVAASVVSYETCIYNERLLTLTSFGEEGERPLDRIYDGTDILVEVHFYVEYEPEINYQGPQYGDGLNAVYVLVPVDTSQPCEVISGWYYDQNGESMFRPEQTVVAEGLTLYQSRMLLHQCQAMAAAGLREFMSPADWTEEELYRYLYFRGQDFGVTEETWQNNRLAIDNGNRLLTIDFTAEDDWYGNQRFLSAEWPGFPSEKIDDYLAGLDRGAVPGYVGENTSWQFRWEGDTLVASMHNESGYAVQEYRFQVYEGFAPWNGRAYCVEGQTLH